MKEKKCYGQAALKHAILSVSLREALTFRGDVLQRRIDIFQLLNLQFRVLTNLDINDIQY